MPFSNKRKIPIPMKESKKNFTPWIFRMSFPGPKEELDIQSFVFNFVRYNSSFQPLIT